MAVSVSASTIASLNSGRSNRLAASSYSSNLSSSSSLQFPLRLRRVRIETAGLCSPSGARVLPLVTISSFVDLMFDLFVSLENSKE